MSHITRVKTQMVERAYLIQALRDLGHRVEEGNVEVGGWGTHTQAEIKVPASGLFGRDIGFRKAGDAYEMVADWWGSRGGARDEFLQQVTQRYAYTATRAKLAEQGFDLVTEEQQQDGRIHLVLRRTTY